MRAATTRGYLLVVAAACMWGSIGLFFNILHSQFGFSGINLAFLRAGTAAVVSVAVMLLVRPAQLRVSPRALFFYLLYGFCGVSAFYFSYAQAIIQTGVTLAAVLLYTAPAFVTLVAWQVWREPLSARKLTALVFTFCGCALVARAYDPTQLSVNVPGIALGLAAGFTYALYTIFSKFALERYPLWPAVTYALVFGAIFLAPFQSPDALAPLVRQPQVWVLLLGLAVGPTLGSLLLYNSGLRHVPASNASLVATIEPVVASILAFAFVGERLGFLQVIGGALVVGGAVWLSTGKTAQNEIRNPAVAPGSAGPENE